MPSNTLLRTYRVRIRYGKIIYQYHRESNTLQGWLWPAAMLDINVDSNAVVQRRPPAFCPVYHTAGLLTKLDARERPGISEAEFIRLFVKCACGRYTTRRAFRDHDCLNEVVDLAR